MPVVPRRLALLVGAWSLAGCGLLAVDGPVATDEHALATWHEVLDPAIADLAAAPAPPGLTQVYPPQIHPCDKDSGETFSMNANGKWESQVRGAARAAVPRLVGFMVTRGWRRTGPHVVAKELAGRVVTLRFSGSMELWAEFSFPHAPPGCANASGPG